MNDGRMSSPATARNREPIGDVLSRVVPSGAHVLEIASGAGEHAAHFAKHLPVASWQPTDPSEDALASIEAWRRNDAVAALRAPLRLDVTAPWPVDAADVVVCINMIHIAPWEACEALVRGAAEVLPPGGVLFLYGPYKRDGAHTAPSNEAFDASLRARNAAWGVRDLEAVVALAELAGFRPPEVVAMPANNLSVIFRKGQLS